MAETSKDGTSAAEIIREWLVRNGYDGLCNPDAECGCDLEDLNPCGWPCNLSGCVCAYKGVNEDGDDCFYLDKSEAENSMQPSDYQIGRMGE